MALAGARAVTFARDVSLVRLRREELDMKLVELAEQAGCHAAMLSMCEGGFVPQADTREKIAAALSTTPGALWPQEYR
jgi:transcriptional regulator with XRE-family HTH domain